MKLVKFPVFAAERWTLGREFDNLRFDILSARSLADRLRQRNATQFLAEHNSKENIRTALMHLESITQFFAELHALSDRAAEGPDAGSETQQ